MPTKTTRIRRGVLVGKKDRLEVERWSCDVCRAEFLDYHDAVRHEDNCRVTQSRTTVVETARPFEVHRKQLVAGTASDDLLSISSTTNVYNNYPVGGDNRESRDVTDGVIPLVIHVARPQMSTIPETRDEGDDMTDMYTLRHDFRRQIASNKDVIKEQFHDQRALSIKTLPAIAHVEVDGDKEPFPIRSGNFMASVVQQQIATISNMQYRFPPNMQLESTPKVSSMPGHDRDEVIGIQRRLPVPSSPPEAAANGYWMGRTNYCSPTNIYAPEYETSSPIRMNSHKHLKVQPAYTNEVDRDYLGTTMDASVKRNRPKENQTTTHFVDIQQRQESYRDKEEIEPTSSEMKWVCDCCRKAQFGSYVDAFRHEMQCRTQKLLLSQQQTELDTLVHSVPEKELRLSANRRALRQERIKRQMYEKSRSLCSTMSDARTVTAISNIRESLGGAIGLSGKSSTSTAGVTKWLCSICKEVCFDHYLDACRHEKECVRLRRGRHHPQLLQQLDE